MNVNQMKYGSALDTNLEIVDAFMNVEKEQKRKAGNVDLLPGDILEKTNTGIVFGNNPMHATKGLGIHRMSTAFTSWNVEDAQITNIRQQNIDNPVRVDMNAWGETLAFSDLHHLLNIQLWRVTIGVMIVQKTLLS